MNDNDSVEHRVNDPSTSNEYDPRNPETDGFLTRLYNAGAETWDDMTAWADSIQAPSNGEYKPVQSGLKSMAGATAVAAGLLAMPACDSGPGPKPPGNDDPDTTDKVDSVDATASLRLFTQRGGRARGLPVTFIAGDVEKQDTLDSNGEITVAYRAPETLNNVYFTGGSEDSTTVKPFSKEYPFSKSIDEISEVEEYSLPPNRVNILLADTLGDGVSSNYAVWDGFTDRKIIEGQNSWVRRGFSHYSMTDSLRFRATLVRTELEGLIDTTLALEDVTNTDVIAPADTLTYDF